MTSPEAGVRNGWRAIASDLIMVGAASGLIYTGIAVGSARQSLESVERTVVEHAISARAMLEENARMASRILVLESRVSELERRLAQHEDRKP